MAFGSEYDFFIGLIQRVVAYILIYIIFIFLEANEFFKCFGTNLDPDGFAILDLRIHFFFIFTVGYKNNGTGITE